MTTPRRILTVIVFTAFLLLPVGAYAQRQDIYDWWRLREYQASSRISALADNTTMTTYAVKVFYVTHPQLDQAQDFRQHCSDSEVSIILGCYSTAQHIYLYDVKDIRLAGVVEVTAAHEMLHAAYDRLSDDERKSIDQLTQRTFDSLSDQRVKTTIEQYRSKDPNVVPTELHSILATEVRQLPGELEDYYRRYFNDRAKVVAFSEQYEAEFTKRNQQIDAYDSQIKELKDSIAGAETRLSQQLEAIKAERDRLSGLTNANRTTEYNAAVPAFNSQVNSYNAGVRSVKQLIEQHNELVAVRNELAKEIRDLVGAIDTRAVPQQTE